MQGVTTVVLKSVHIILYIQYTHTYIHTYTSYKYMVVLSHLRMRTLDGIRLAYYTGLCTTHTTTHITTHTTMFTTPCPRTLSVVRPAFSRTMSSLAIMSTITGAAATLSPTTSSPNAPVTPTSPIPPVPSTPPPPTAPPAPPTPLPSSSPSTPIGTVEQVE